MDLFDLAQRVKRGVKLLDKKVPGWRRVMRTHADQFKLSDPECCVLGTLEHYSARLRALNKKYVVDYDCPDYHRAVRRLNLEFGSSYGFDNPCSSADQSENDRNWTTLQDLWKAEFLTEATR